MPHQGSGRQADAEVGASRRRRRRCVAAVATAFIAGSGRRSWRCDPAAERRADRGQSAAPGDAAAVSAARRDAQVEARRGEFQRDVSPVARCPASVAEPSISGRRSSIHTVVGGGDRTPEARKRLLQVWPRLVRRRLASAVAHAKRRQTLPPRRVRCCSHPEPVPGAVR